MRPTKIPKTEPAPHIQPTCTRLKPNSAAISSNSTGSDICGIATTNVNVNVDIVRTNHQIEPNADWICFLKIMSSPTSRVNEER
jgi:hypothetical protein